MSQTPEYNVNNHDYTERGHLRYGGPIADMHSHVMVTRPGDPEKGPPLGEGPGASTAQAATMLDVAEEFGIVHTVTMCFPDDIPILRAEFGDSLAFNGPIQKKTIDSPDDDAYRLLDQFLKHGVKIIKFWAAPRGLERGLLVDTPWRIEAARRAEKAGVRILMVHVADPDTWFQTAYADVNKYGTKESHYIGLERLLAMFPNMTVIGAHMGGDPEHPDHLEALLEKYPNFMIDTSATKWQVREVSARRDAIRDLVCRYSDRFLFGTDLVTRHRLDREHYVSRYWCQRTLWESGWRGRSPIRDPDYTEEPGIDSPILHGVELPADVLEKVYWKNAEKLLHLDELIPQQEESHR